MSLSPSIRLHLYFARDSHDAVILRQGPSKQFRMILWHRNGDRFEDGQWLKHKVYTERCDLSPDGRHFVYFALDGRWGSPAKGSYTAISRPPYFTALALFPQGDTWGGGGRFIDKSHVQIDSRSGDIIGNAKDIRQVFQGETGKGCTSGLRYGDGTPMRMSRQTRTRVMDGDDWTPPHHEYHTRDGVLYRRRDQDLTPIRDFTDMTFEPIKAPYGSDSAANAGHDWHPLDEE